ncbi:MAG: hypothetical protein EYC70_10520 [Planctomycetota bacterium]|nr:MAG: hypothetical protein EYC70_10520 [Planctomycetota bacterium]
MLVTLASTLVLAASVQAPAAAEGLGAAKDFVILYAGDPATERAKAFTQFLQSSFRKVDTIELKDLSQQSAAPYDVVVADWHRMYGEEEMQIDIPHVELDPGFSKPIVMIGAVGGSIQHHTKIGWL